MHRTLVVAFMGEGDVIIPKLFQSNARCKNYGHWWPISTLIIYDYVFTYFATCCRWIHYIRVCNTHQVRQINENGCFRGGHVPSRYFKEYECLCG